MNMVIHKESVLSQRQQEILRFIINEHINTNAPIGSRNISRFAKYSPATIRNEMADLEYMGYLVQPHASAGRLPSVEGYRYYLSELIKLDSQDVAVKEEQQLIQHIQLQNSPIDKLMQDASKALYEITKSVAIVTAPTPENPVIRDIRIVEANPSLALLIVVTSNGSIYNVSLDISYLAEHRVDFEYLNSVLSYYIKNTTISDLNKNIDMVLSQVQSLYDNTVGIARLLNAILEQIISYSPSIFVAGEKALLNVPGGSEKSEQLYDLIHDSSSCWNFIQGLSNQEDKIEVDNANIIIGDDDSFLDKYAIIQVNYGNLETGKGNVVLIGLRHMSYMRNIVALNLLKNSLTQAIKK